MLFNMLMIRIYLLPLFRLCLSTVSLINIYLKFLHSFGRLFILLGTLLYTDIHSRVLVNGFTSREFPVQCSVRQGCRLSPLLCVCTLHGAICS